MVHFPYKATEFVTYKNKMSHKLSIIKSLKGYKKPLESLGRQEKKLNTFFHCFITGCCDNTLCNNVSI